VGRPRSTPVALATVLLLAAAALAAPPDDAVGEFKKAWTRAQDPAARQAALRALGGSPSVEGARTLARVALDGQLDWATREVAVSSLCAISAPEVVLWASEAVGGKEKDAPLRAVLCDFLGVRATHDPQLASLLLPALEDASPAVQVAAIRGVCRTRTPTTVDALVRLLERPTTQGRVLGDCLRALRGLTGERFGTPLEWRSWWETARAGYAVPTEEELADRAEPGAAPAEGYTTVTRLDPPGEGGSSIYGGIDSSAVLFVVDVSYSMHVKVLAGDGTNPTRLDYVKEALAGVIEKELDEKDTFNIIAFSTEVKAWKRKLVAATAANKREATRYVRGLRLEAETNISDALELAFQHPDVDTIYFLTDGMPTQGRTTIPDDILGLVRGWNAGRNVRVCTIAFLAGDGAAFQVIENKSMATTFLRALAQQNDGTFTLFD
jgi:hypothetical protein